jgi:hypothetical protein
MKSCFTSNLNATFPTLPEDLPTYICTGRTTENDLDNALKHIRMNFGIYSQKRGNYLFLTHKNINSGIKSELTVFNMNYDGVCYRVSENDSGVKLIFKWKLSPRVKKCDSIDELETYLDGKFTVYLAKDCTTISIEKDANGLHLSTRSHLYKLDRDRDQVSLKRVKECIGEELLSCLDFGCYEFMISHPEIQKTQLSVRNGPQAIYVKRGCDMDIEGVPSYTPIAMTKEKLISYFKSPRRTMGIWGYIIVPADNKLSLIIPSEDLGIQMSANYKSQHVPFVCDRSLEIIQKNNDEGAIMTFLASKGKVEIMRNNPGIALFPTVVHDLAQLIVLDNPYQYKLLFEQKCMEYAMEMTEDRYDELSGYLLKFAVMHVEKFKCLSHFPRYKGMKLETKLQGMNEMYIKLSNTYNELYTLKDISSVLAISATKRDIEILRGDGSSEAVKQLYTNLCTQTSYEKYVYCV